MFRRFAAVFVAFSALTALTLVGRTAGPRSVAAELAPTPQAATRAPAADVDRSPVDLVLGPDESWLVTINQTSHTASLVRTADGSVLDEISVGQHPTAIARCGESSRVLIASSHGGDVTLLEVRGTKLHQVARLELGFEPQGVAVSPDGRTAYVSLSAAHQVAVLDLEGLTIVDRFDVAPWPRSLALTPDGTKLVVVGAGEGSVAVYDVARHKLVFEEAFGGVNIEQPCISHNGEHVYFPWMRYGESETSPGAIRQGWVFGSRIGRLGLNGPRTRNGISLDPPGRAVADPYTIALTRDGRWLVASASGTHELLFLRLANLPFIALGGSEHMDAALREDSQRFGRVWLDGRPMGFEITADDRTAYVANYLTNEVQVVDLREQEHVRSIHLGGPSLDERSPARTGEAIFYDAGRSLDQWYSCHTCHREGGGNVQIMDTFNDGSSGTYKTVLPLYHVDRTGPWTWHGWQSDLKDAMTSSLTKTMRGPQPTEEDAESLIAFFAELQPPPNPHRSADGSLTEAAERGKLVFQSAKAGCANCHSGPEFTDGEIHDVGLGSADDRYEGYNTPSLVGVYRKSLLLHHGRASSLDELLTGLHNPQRVTGEGELSDEERRDLIEYLKSL